MKLTFPTFGECLSAFEVIDGSRSQSAELAPCLIFKNVRVFNDWSVVPLSRLNVLTGPNSSGKSTVTKLITLFDGATFRKSVESLAQEVHRNIYVGFAADWGAFSKLENKWFDLPNETFSDRYLATLRKRFQEAQKAAPKGAHPKRLIYIAESGGEDGPFTIYLYGDTECLGIFTFGSNVSVGGPDELDGRFSFKTSPALCRYLYAREFCDEIQELQETYLPSFRKKWLGNKELAGSTALKGPEYFFEVADSNPFDFVHGATMSLGHDIDDLETAGVTYLLLNRLVRDPVLLMNRFSSEVLPSIRPISTPAQLTYRYETDSVKDRAINLHEQSGDTASAFRRLASMLADEKTKHQSPLGSGRQALRDINRWTQLILGGPHKMGCRVSSQRITGKRHPWAESEHWRGAHFESVVVELFLLASNNKELSLADVGTGVSQVLPVIAEIGAIPWGSVLPYAVAISQPELHLHPRAQSSLGDLFLTAMNKGATLAIETHSEHLILRLLRRIKERSPRKSPLRLGEEDLSLIYLNPTDEAAEVHWIRVDSKGEFVDAWPEGFFEDRYEDLFFERA